MVRLFNHNRLFETGFNNLCPEQVSGCVLRGFVSFEPL